MDEAFISALGVELVVASFMLECSEMRIDEAFIAALGVALLVS